MLRMKDWVCVCCGHEEEILGTVGDPDPEHCGSTMDFIWTKAPGINFKPHYSHALGRKVQTYSEEEKALAKQNSWIATKGEANSSYGTDIFKDDMVIQPKEKAEIRKSAEKAVKLLKDKNVIRSTGSGFEMVGSKR